MFVTRPRWKCLDNGDNDSQNSRLADNVLSSDTSEDSCSVIDNLDLLDDSTTDSDFLHLNSTANVAFSTPPPLPVQDFSTTDLASSQRGEISNHPTTSPYTFATTSAIQKFVPQCMTYTINT